MKPLSHRPILLWLVLPAALFLLTLLLCGAFFESNDDAVLALLLRGEMVVSPVSDFQYYLHGLGHFLAGLYRQFPALPWYGLVLYALLLAALVLSSFFLVQNWQTRATKSGWFWLAVFLLFLGAWTEHIMWFSFVRVAIVLAGAAMLACAGVPGLRKKWPVLVFCLLFFVLALCLRPRAAFLGIACALPALWWLVPVKENKSKNLLKTLLPFAVALLVFQALLLISTSPAEKELRQINRLKSELVEYHHLLPAPENRADSLSITAVQNWLLADGEMVNPDLFARATQPITLVSQMQQIPQKLATLVTTFGKDYFLLMFLQVVLVFQITGSGSALPNKKLFVTWQVLFWLGLLALGLWLKLPPRVATACISVHLLGAMGISARFAAVNLFRHRIVLAAGVLLVGLQLYKIAHRISWQQHNRQEHEQFLSLIPENFSGKTLVTAQLGEQMGSLSPFRNYHFGNNQLLRITGWPTLLPSYPQQLKQLTGKAGFAEAMQVLADQEHTLFLLPVNFPDLLTAYFQEHYQVRLSFERQEYFPAGLQQQGYGVYKARLSQ